ncbi:DEAD/DEAH box helicase [Paenibacillus rigui]|uniref:DNA/RNA helicase n=1 Tax=Paenibacillus rigui TaxID=554312 RepID=A0A229UTY8_9BACL|nr:helicase-related protein [Paenibacillus rigui]OXM86369.1 DNA/RNA helicase [Paenibacillus rigui]
MKAAIYAIMNEQGFTWQVTLNIEADFTHWFGPQRNPRRILLLDPAISFGQAFMLKDKLNELDWSSVHSTIMGKSGAIDVYRGLLKRVHAASAELFMKMNPFGQAPPRQLQLFECDWEKSAAYLAASGRGTAMIKDEELQQLGEVLQGRSLLLDEFHQLLTEYQLSEALVEPLLYLQAGYLRGMWHLHQGIHKRRRSKLAFWSRDPGYECRRCGSGSSHMVMTDCIFCGTVCPYCEQCLTMGRSRYCSVTVSGAGGQWLGRQHVHQGRQESEGSEGLKSYIEPWGLSEIQAEASGKALEFMKGDELHKRFPSGNESRQFLIWAVTGAGKTEMIFPMIHYMIDKGGKVVIATPRRDVVLELKPRIEKAFAPTSVVTLYGGSDQRWASGAITIATTHQLMRFEQAFDLVIIDELDAFPYHNNPMLQYAAQKVCKPDGMTILLSATPPVRLQRAASRGRLPHVKVTARYHRHPLPVPKIVMISPLKKQLQKAVLDNKIVEIIQTSIDRGAQLFVFVPKIHMVEPLTALLSRAFPQVITRGTSSKDGERAQKVTDFRGKETRILVTTTILERGVTIPKSDVLILDADEPIFDSAALVQMAGRAGRSAEDPAGHVYFAAKEKTRAQAEAVRQIQGMNRLARRKGYLIEKGAGAHRNNQ